MITRTLVDGEAVGGHQDVFALYRAFQLSYHLGCHESYGRGVSVESFGSFSLLTVGTPQFGQSLLSLSYQTVDVLDHTGILAF